MILNPINLVEKLYEVRQFKYRFFTFNLYGELSFFGFYVKKNIISVVFIQNTQLI